MKSWKAKEYGRDTVPGDYAMLQTPCPIQLRHSLDSPGKKHGQADGKDRTEKHPMPEGGHLPDDLLGECEAERDADGDLGCTPTLDGLPGTGAQQHQQGTPIIEPSTQGKGIASAKATYPPVAAAASVRSFRPINAEAPY